MTQLKLTPLKINLLLHIYSIAAPFTHPDKPIYEMAKEEFIHHSLAERSDHGCGYRILPRGVAFVNMILATPLPLESEVFIDPRNGTIVDIP